jgi:UDP-N-acetylmuramate dehydrogenase
MAGLEWAISIPGSVGGGVRMNAGAHGGEMKDSLRSAVVWRMDRLAVEEVEASDLAMSYRRTSLAATDLVLEARFQLEPEEPASIRARMESYRKHRAETQPGALQNAGSVFKNPEGDSAGRLVEVAGLKGFSVGGVRVSEKHANFFIASDNATAQDVFDLVSAVKTRVSTSLGVQLETEIRFVGEFAERKS